jgi:hypothetical protein
VNKTSGVIRYVPKKKCAANETSLSWNVSGRTGEAGPQGVQGARGLDGDAGATGTDGAKGDAGAAGAKGDAGAAGAKGDTGPAGAKGDTGPAGAKGDTGAAGARGDAGATGPKGDAGAAGSNGTNGTNGTNGIAGTNGTNGTGSLTSISEIQATRSGNSPGAYTSVFSVGSTIDVGISCYTAGGSSTYSLAVKSPTGTTITGGGHLLSSAQNNFNGIVGTANGTLTRLTRGGVGPFESTNDDFFIISIFGSGMSPVEVSIGIKQVLGTCTVNGYALTIA